MKKSIFRAVCLALVLLLTVAALTGCGASGVSTTEYLGTYSTDVTSLIPFYLPDTTGRAQGIHQALHHALLLR